MSLLRITFENPIRANRVKRAVGLVCEVCGSREAPDTLILHSIKGEEEETPGAMEPFLLVLCFRCHTAIHTCGIAPREQERLARQRPGPLRQEIQRILSCIPRPYTPPDTDIEEAYQEACSCRFRFGV